MVVFNGTTAFNEDFGNCAVKFAWDFVHDLHRFDNHEDIAFFNGLTDLYERSFSGSGTVVECADNRGFYYIAFNFFGLFVCLFFFSRSRDILNILNGLYSGNACGNSNIFLLAFDYKLRVFCFNGKFSEICGRNGRNKFLYLFK